MMTMASCGSEKDNIAKAESGVWFDRGDGKVDIEDSVMVISHINGMSALTDDQSERADVDRSTTVDIEDAVAIIGYVNVTGEF